MYLFIRYEANHIVIVFIYSLDFITLFDRLEMRKHGS